MQSTKPSYERFRSLGDFRGQGRPESWLWRILVNVCTAEKRRRVVPIEDPSLTDERRRPRMARDSRGDRLSPRAAEDHPLSSSLRRPRLRPDRGRTRHRPRNGGGNPEHSAHEAPSRTWRGEEMSDYLSSVLDELVPTFERRGWRLGTCRRRRRRRDPRRRCAAVARRRGRTRGAR